MKLITIPRQNNEKLENTIISRQNHENHEILIIQRQNNENHCNFPWNLWDFTTES